MELLVPDPVEGFYVIKENKGNTQHLTRIADDYDGGDSKPFGKIQYLALNSKKDLLALYAESESRGRIIVLKSNY